MENLKQLHEDYRRAKALEGYVYGKVEDDAKKENPFMTDFDQLSEDAKEAFKALVSIKPKAKSTRVRKSAPKAKKAAKIEEPKSPDQTENS